MKHFIFDLGGVVNKQIDRELIKDEIIAPQEKYKDLYMEKYKEMEIGLYTYEEFIKEVNKYLKYPNLEPEEYKKCYIDNGRKYSGVYQDTIDVIYKLKEMNYKVYLLSNCITINYDELCNNMNISVFDKLFLSYEMQLLKPDSKIYLETIKKINDKPSNMYFFDDKLKNVIVAKECGMNAYQCTGENIKEVISKIIK